MDLVQCNELKFVRNQINSREVLQNQCSAKFRQEYSMLYSFMFLEKSFRNHFIFLRRSDVSFTDGILFFFCDCPCNTTLFLASAFSFISISYPSSVSFSINPSRFLKTRHSVECEKVASPNLIRVSSAISLWLLSEFKLYCSIANKYDCSG